MPRPQDGLAALIMAYERLEDTIFTWPAIKDAMMALSSGIHATNKA